MGQYDPLLEINIGGESFTLEDYSLARDIKVEDGRGITGETYTLSGRGYVIGADGNALAVAIAAAKASFETSGQDVTITALGTTPEVRILAAQCLDGGPHFKFKLEEQSGGVALRKSFTITAAVRTLGNGNQSWQTGETTNYKVQTATTPDDRRRVRKSGKIYGATANAILFDTILPAFRSSFGGFVVSFTKTESSDGKSIDYELTAEEYSDPLPASPGASAVEGLLTTRRDLDEQHRLTTSITYDLVVVGDAQSLYDQLRPSEVAIVRESFSFTALRERRAQISFVVVAGGDGSALLSWSDRLSETAQTNPLSVFEVPGANVVIWQGAQSSVRVKHSGRAVGLDKFVKPPEPDHPDNFSAPPVVEYQRLSPHECETTWSYEYAFAQSSQFVLVTSLAKLGRPDEPAFH